jgi:hypothetical protein
MHTRFPTEIIRGVPIFEELEINLSLFWSRPRAVLWSYILLGLKGSLEVPINHNHGKGASASISWLRSMEAIYRSPKKGLILR